MKILGQSVKFHLVRANFPISACGILGTEFLRQNSATLKFENGDTLPNFPNLNASSPYTITLPARTRKLTTLPIVSTNLQEGYLNKISVGPGVFIGESLVRPENGMVKLYAINKTLRDIELTIPPVELQEIESLQASQGQTLMKAKESEGESQKQLADRFSRLLKIFNFSGLNDEEKSSL